MPSVDVHAKLAVGPAERAGFDVGVVEGYARVVFADPVRLSFDHRAVAEVDGRGFGSAGCSLLLHDERRPDRDLHDGSEVGAAFGESRSAGWWGFGLGECGFHGVALEAEVDADGLVVGALPVEVRQDRAETRRVRRKVVHAFDSMMVAVNSNIPARYHLQLTSAGCPVAQGWWGSETVARGKFKEWVGSGVADARVTLVDEETSETLTTWPDEA